MRSEALPSRTLRDAIQPTAMNAAYITTTARTAGFKGSARERQLLRAPQRGVSSHQRNVVHKTRGRDQLVRRVAAHIEVRAGVRNLARDRPDVHAPQNADHFRILQV